jgi:hypothetical protein
MQASKKPDPTKKPVAENTDYSEEIKKMDEMSRQHMESARPIPCAVNIGIPVRPIAAPGACKPESGPGPKPGSEGSKPQNDISDIMETAGTMGRLAMNLAVSGLRRLNETLGGMAYASVSGPHQGNHSGSHCCRCGCHSMPPEHGGHHHGHGRHHGCENSIGNYDCCEPGVRGC